MHFLKSKNKLVKDVTLINQTASKGMATSIMSKNKVETGGPVSDNPTMMDKLSNYIIVDIGANLTNKKFSRDLDQVIQRATDAGTYISL